SRSARKVAHNPRIRTAHGRGPVSARLDARWKGAGTAASVTRIPVTPDVGERSEGRSESLQQGGGGMTTEATTEAGVPTWELDPAHSSVEFSVKHMMMTTVRGRFKEIEATLTGDRDQPEAAGVEARITVDSIDTGVPDRDAHLRSADFFDAENHPVIV